MYLDVLLTMHLSIILVINNLMRKFLVYNKIYYMPLHVLSAMCSSSGGQICIRHLCTGRPPTGVMIPDAVYYNFDLLMMST